MFIDNKYKKQYDRIIRHATVRILDKHTIIEKHHIIPTCMGGTNIPNNIVKLTAREHFICHQLLTKCVIDPDSKRKLLFALGKFLQNGQGQERILTSRQYEIARKAVKEARTGYKHTAETRKKISDGLKGNIPWNKGKQGVQKHTEESCKKISIALTGYQHTVKAKANMSAGKLGHKAGMTGKKHTMETKKKMSKNMKGKRGQQKRIEMCPSCDSRDVTYRHIKFCQEKQC